MLRSLTLWPLWFAALAVAIVPAAFSVWLNAEFGRRLGSDNPELMATFLGGLDVLKVALPTLIGIAWARRAWGSAVAGAAGFVALATLSVFAAFSVHVGDKSAKAGGTEAQVARIAEWKTARSAAQRELDALPGARPVELLQRMLERERLNPIWDSSAGCTDATAERSRRYCSTYKLVESELAAANRAELLRTTIGDMSAKILAGTTGDTLAPVRPAIDLIVRWLGLDATVAQANVDGLHSLIFAVLVDLVACFSVTLAIACRPMSPTPAHSPVAAALEKFREAAPAQVADATTPSVQVAETTAVQPVIAQTPPRAGRSSAGLGAPVRADRTAVALASSSAGLPTNVVQLSPLKSQTKCRSTGDVETATNGALAVQVAHSPPPSSGSASGAPASAGQAGSSGDDVQVFVQVAIKPRRGAEVASGDIQAAYSEWCRSTGRPMVSPVSLGIRLAQLGLKKRRSNSRTSYLDVELVA